MPGLVQASDRGFSDADWHPPFFRNHPGIIKTRHELNRAKKPAEIFRWDADGYGDVAGTVRGHGPKQEVIRQKNSARQAVTWTVELECAGLAVIASD